MLELNLLSSFASIVLYLEININKVLSQNESKKLLCRIVKKTKEGLLVEKVII